MSIVKDKIKLFGIMIMMKAAYKYLLRDILLKAIDDPDEEWDDTVMEIIDRLFDYKGAE